jgi:hypothetical protein
MTELDYMRATALALRDLAEGSGATDATFTFEGDVQLVWSVDDGFHLLQPGSEPLEITDWVDHMGWLPVPGVESVREQPALLAEGRK